jgi:hypothetical protein
MANESFRPVRPERGIPVLFSLFLVVVGVPLAAGLYVDVRWFESLGHAEMFTTVLGSKLGVGLAVAGLAGAFAFANLRLASRRAHGLHPLFLYDAAGIARANLGELAMRLVIPASVLLGLVLGVFFYPRWSTWLLFVHGTSFGIRDPIFDRDIGFYVFRLPLWRVASSLAFWVLATTSAATAGLYLARGAITTGDSGFGMHRVARAHLGVLAATILAVLSWQAYLAVFETLYSRVGPMTGASYADVHALLPALRIKVALTAVGAALVLAGIAREGYGFAILAVVLYVGAQIGVQTYPSLVHRFSVQPNELERETPYLRHHIQATRAAYGLDRVQERELSARNSLTAADIEENRATFDNVRLWDHHPLLDTFAQIQEIRTYYDFASVDNDRYLIGGKLRQTMLSPRELSAASLPNRTWINERFVFTHGYGLTLGFVNEATPEGLPVLIVQDIPPISRVPELRVTQPSIYFGELSNDYVLVRTETREFHYPSGEGNVETEYEGKGGIRFDSAFTRLALALHLGSLKLLLSNDIHTESRVLLHRNVVERVRRIAPFLMLDPDPYLVLRDDGTLAWIVDAYTTSSRYPYAEAVGDGINYIRNSVKVVVDAYHGDVTFYAADERDPILRAWRRAFPRDFEPLSAMPADLRGHLRHPLLIFGIQTELFATYHMAEPALLYNREDQWEVPALVSGENKEPMQPYYTVMRLPGEDQEEFILMLPFTPKRKDNLAAWMVARSDGDALGELIAYRFPRDRLVFGPQQVVNRINQDPEISRQVSLWGQRGSQALFGTLLVIPVAESLIYVRPLYLRSEGGKIPELKRVIVAYENRIAMEPSLEGALDKIFGRETPVPRPVAGLPPADEAGARDDTGAPSTPPPGDLPLPTVPADAAREARALGHFERAVRAQRAGDWAGYGRELVEVERLLREMQSAPAGDAATAGRGATPP